MLLVQPLAAPLHEQVHVTESKQNRALHVEHEGLSVEDLVRSAETHAWRRELSSVAGRSDLSARYKVGLRMGMYWVLGARRVDEMTREEVEESARGITGWDIVGAAGASEEGLEEGEGDGEVEGEGGADGDDIETRIRMLRCDATAD